MSHSDPSCLVLETFLRLIPRFLEFSLGWSVELTSLAGYSEVPAQYLRGVSMAPSVSLHSAAFRNPNLVGVFENGIGLENWQGTHF